MKFTELTVKEFENFVQNSIIRKKPLLPNEREYSNT